MWYNIRMMATNITYNRLRELVYYENGELYWIKNDVLAGSIDDKGYKRISLDNKRYKLHRIIWFFFHQEWPKKQIDHIDGNKLNNNIENLRDVNQSINMYNKCLPHKNSSTKYLGVSKSGKKYVARLKVENALIHLGTYKTPEEAHLVYLKKKQEVLNGFSLSSMD